MPAGKSNRITLRQYLIYGGLERGWSTAKSEQFVAEFAKKRPHLNLNEKATHADWERRRLEGVLA